MKGVSDTACCFVRFLPSAFVHDVLVVPPPGWMCLPFPPDRQHNVVHRLSCRIANTRQLQMCWNMVVFAVRYTRLAADKTTTRGHLTSMPTAHLCFCYCSETLLLVISYCLQLEVKTRHPSLFMSKVPAESKDSKLYLCSLFLICASSLMLRYLLPA